MMFVTLVLSSLAIMGIWCVIASIREAKRKAILEKKKLVLVMAIASKMGIDVNAVITAQKGGENPAPENQQNKDLA